MSARAWDRRRLRKRITLAARHLERHPMAAVMVASGVVAISLTRYNELMAVRTRLESTREDLVASTR